MKLGISRDFASEKAETNILLSGISRKSNSIYLKKIISNSCLKKFQSSHGIEIKNKFSYINKS